VTEYKSADEFAPTPGRDSAAGTPVTAPVDEVVDVAPVAAIGDAVPDTEPAVPGKPWWKTTVAIVSFGAAVVVAACGVTIAVVIARTPDPNAAACKDFESSYSALATGVKMRNSDVITIPDLLDIQSKLPASLQAAADEGAGKIRSSMNQSSAMALAWVDDSSNPDLGTAFFLSTHTVKELCDAAGNRMTLESFK
jgi:hypothetical protein